MSNDSIQKTLRLFRQFGMSELSVIMKDMSGAVQGQSTQHVRNQLSEPFCAAVVEFTNSDQYVSGEVETAFVQAKSSNGWKVAALNERAFTAYVALNAGRPTWASHLLEPNSYLSSVRLATAAVGLVAKLSRDTQLVDPSTNGFTTRNVMDALATLTQRQEVDSTTPGEFQGLMNVLSRFEQNLKMPVFSNEFSTIVAPPVSVKPAPALSL